MNKSRSHLQITLVLAGIVSLLATLALGAVTMRPTEAAWQDSAHGESVFGMANPYANNHFARSIAGFGSIMSGTANGRSLGPDLREALPATDWISRADRPANWAGVDSGGFFPAVRASADTRTCARRENRSPTSCGPLQENSSAASYAVSELRNLDAKATPPFRSIPMVSSSSTPIIATASCSPGQTGRATLSSGSPLTLGDPDSSDRRAIAIPRAGQSQTLPPQRSEWHTYSATIEHVSEQQPGRALSQLRLRVEVTNILVKSETWSFNAILAHAECGISRPATDRPAQPQAGSPAVLNQQRMAPSDAPAALQSILEVAEDQAATDSEASDDNAGQDTVDTELPSMDDASAENARPEVDDAGVPTSPTTSQATSAAAPSSTAPTEAPEPEASEATTETATPEATKPPVTTEVPRAAKVDVGRWFSLTGPGGVELGAAKVENIVRTPGCGVELTLSITTSAEAGADRWASIGPDDFAEVRAGGSTRDAARISSDCVQSSSSRTTALSPGRDYQIVISFLIDDSAQQAMLRPGNTAGWFFDLPPLTRAAVSTTAAPTTAAPPAAPSIATVPAKSETAETSQTVGA